MEEGEEGEGQMGRGCVSRQQLAWSQPDVEGDQHPVLGADSLHPRAYHSATFVEALGCSVVFGGFAQVSGVYIVYWSLHAVSENHVRIR